jgi:hypothetical protein
VIFIILGIIIGIVYAIVEQDYYLAPLFFAFIAMLFSGFLSLFFTSSWYSYDFDSKDKLVSLTAAVGTNGSFFLGSGVVDSDLYYYYYIKQGNQIVPEKIQATDNNVSIIESNDAPKVMHYITGFKHSYLDAFIFPVYCMDKTVIYIPKGSIKINYHM